MSKLITASKIKYVDGQTGKEIPCVSVEPVDYDPEKLEDLRVSFQSAIASAEPFRTPLIEHEEEDEEDSEILKI